MTDSAGGTPTHRVLRFGVFELDIEAEQLLKNGRVVKLQPKPFRLLCLLVEQEGKLVTREDIQQALWSAETFVDFEQGVNFAIKQVREALGEDASRALYIQTVPKRGYRFIAPVDRGPAAQVSDAVYRPMTDGSLNKLVWTHIAEFKIIENRLQKQRKLAIALSSLALVLMALIAGFLLFR